ncbi:hypothetical protein GGU11DRAFT_749968 [Lentinula aff. detonsa]|nr:hypothetical protein GGU11DRAFT_749968 [Lentinula aff. detonsa]
MLGRKELQERLVKAETLKCLLTIASGELRQLERQRIATQLQDHIDAAYPLQLANFDAIAERAGSIESTRRIPFLPQPAKTSPCPFCLKNFVVPKGWEAHMRLGDALCSRTTEHQEARLTQGYRWQGHVRLSQPLSSKKSEARERIILAESYVPDVLSSTSTPMTSTQKPRQLFQPPYFPQHWWDFLVKLKYRPALSVMMQTQQQGLDSSLLLDLVVPPSKSLAKKYVEGTTERKREDALVLCRSFFSLYLQDAAEHASSTFGFSETLRRYSGLRFRGAFKRKGTFDRYGKVATAFISFVLRYNDSKQLRGNL